MTRVLHVLGGLNRGGAETWMMQVLRRIQGHGIHIDFVVQEDGPFDYRADAEALGARVIVCRDVRFPLLYALNLVLILKRYGPYQAVHSHIHYFSGVVLLAATMARVPVRVVQSHLDTRQLDAHAGIGRRMYMRTIKRLIWTCTTVGTEVSARAAEALFPPDWRYKPKWEVRLLGISPEPFQRDVDGCALRRELAIPAGHAVIGHVGRFDAQKNHTFLLRIAAEHLKKAPNTTFLLVGAGPLQDRIRGEAREMEILDNVCFAGVREDVPALMRGVMNAFLMPSLFEGLPLVLMEAQAAGLPCLLSSGIAEEIDVVPSLMVRESLTSPAEIWSSRLLTMMEADTKTESHTFPEPFSIDASIRGLMKCYSLSNIDRSFLSV